MHVDGTKRVSLASIFGFAVFLILGHGSPAHSQDVAADGLWPDPPAMELDAGSYNQDIGTVMRISWLPPEIDPLPDTYDIEVSDVDSPDPNELQIIDLASGVELETTANGELVVVVTGYFDFARPYKVRIRGKDAQGGVVSWSPWSAVYAFEVPYPVSDTRPSAPGQPVLLD